VSPGKKGFEWETPLPGRIKKGFFPSASSGVIHGREKKVWRFSEGRVANKPQAG